MTNEKDAACSGVVQDSEKSSETKGNEEKRPKMLRSNSSSSDAPDPYNLKRFTKHQEYYHPIAIKELLAGRKRSCWAWYIFPTPPFIRNGRRVGSAMNREYELADEAETRAYLRFEHGGVNLRTNYLEVMGVIAKQLDSGIEVDELVGHDAPRLVSSVKHFAVVANALTDENKPFDRDVHQACTQVIDLL
mmetsp:Transcript_26709/g.58610  ORF Transcript_26709/g.58610 Transcript_26709/m.58610 type:complete len:190 (-) Transcript_26709:244-813(-)